MSATKAATTGLNATYGFIGLGHMGMLKHRSLSLHQLNIARLPNGGQLEIQDPPICEIGCLRYQQGRVRQARGAIRWS